MTKHRREGIRTLLRKLEGQDWDDYMLFAASDTLLLVYRSTGRVVAEYYIPCDGGDPSFVDRNGTDYIGYYIDD